MQSLRRLLSFRTAAPIPPSLQGGRVLSIVITPSTALRGVCEPVAWPLSPNSAELVADLLATAAEGGGGTLGLAAPQIGVASRVIVVRTPARVAALRSGGLARGGFVACLNPRVIAASPAEALGVEACLSEPGREALVRRAVRLRVAWTCAASGAALEADLAGLPAAVWQHEVDHLDGTLCTDREAPTPGGSRARAAALRRAADRFRVAYAEAYDDSDLDGVRDASFA